ncbi:ATP-binding protein [Treponema sp. TIM-1]|uniref:ATP-binding protein n=1 Tax=Treponema sp. TIM-1 TaxID=2898417 RepID=UPI00397FDC3A
MIGTIVLKFLTSNKFENPQDELVMDEIVRYITFNIALVIGSVFLISFGITVVFEGNTIRGIADLLIGFICIIILFLLRTKVPFTACGLIVLVPFGILCLGLLLSGGARGFAGLWIFTYPPIVIFILGLYIGSVLSGLLFVGLMTITIIPGIAEFNYFLPIAFRFIAVYILVVVLTITYEQIRILKDRWLRQLTATLKSERDEVSVMKDNLKAGVFLMDKDYTIQPAYSKALEEILGMDELQGKKFTDLLSASLKAKERDTLEDYFEMVIKRSFDPKMLEEINPIVEFFYINEITGEEKILRTTFAAVDRGYGIFFILGSLEDITTEKSLQKQLEEEESKRNEEMRALFQVIQVEPRVFNDFIEDMEYDFDRINNILKDKNLSARQAMVDIYQSVHAIKSNALILGLENFSGKLHELESKIKELRDQEDISFDEVLHITVELEKLMKEKDKFRDIIDKIQSFRVNMGESRRQDRYVLVETLTKACEKASAALNKKAQFVVEDLDGLVLEYGPRRIIKEVLTQLVRNAVYHGLESPEERNALGKPPQGLIRLFIKYQDNQIHIKLSDDGRGLDFEKIREKAERLHLFKHPEDAADKNQLLKAIFSPGFSTVEEADVHAGRGIGLSLVRERIRELRGSIKLQSEPGKGTIFNIYIPLEIKNFIKKAS